MIDEVKNTLEALEILRIPQRISILESRKVSITGRGMSQATADATYLKLDNSNQSSWTPSTTVVTNLNADKWDGLDAPANASADVEA